ncbi:MAG: hypothetical protein JKY50_00325 [Oleispira sp.]|nr:hypothetical protein [Oleispira sp.]
MSRKSRLTADVTLEAHNLLRDYCIKHERSKGFLLEKMIRKFCGEVEAAPATQVAVVKKPKAPKIKRKAVSYPSNLDDQFLLLWDSKGKKGQKQKAYDIFRKMCIDVTNDICEQATLLMITDLHKNKHEAGYPERHLTSYLNGKFWEE